jgi:apolipoprotein N-acyltransferase
MAFASKNSLPLATVVVVSTTALLLLGNGMNPVWPFLWVAPVPVLLLAAEFESTLGVAVAAALSMFLGTLTMLYYLHFVLGAPTAAWLVPFLIISLIFSAGILLFRALLRRGEVAAAVISLPALWTVFEYFSSFSAANGTAGSLAYTQLRFLPFLQLASVTGPWGMTFLLLLFPSALAAGFHVRHTKPLHAVGVVGSVFCLLAAVILFGIVRLSGSISGQDISVGLLATDTVQIADPGFSTQALLHRYADAAEKLGRQGARIIVMPEKVGVLRDLEAKAADATLQPVADRTGATLVIGLVHAGEARSFNEARIYAPNQPVATYNKHHMLPPFESKLTPGTSLTFLSRSGGPVGIAICKDMDFIRPALDYGRAGTALILDPAWDFNVDRAWHGHIAIMRGVENGYAIAHSAKDGLLTVTDSRGRILGELRSDAAPFSSLLVEVPLHHDGTIFSRYGAWFPLLAGVLLTATLTRLAVSFIPSSRAIRTLRHQNAETQCGNT